MVTAFKHVRERSTKNYCPVSLLCVVSKVFRKLNNNLADHLRKCGLFPDFQYGFRFENVFAAM